MLLEADFTKVLYFFCNALKKDMIKYSPGCGVVAMTVVVVFSSLVAAGVVLVTVVV